jgi:hypothetical protein
MVSAIEIQDVRLSFIWVETSLSLLTSQRPVQTPLSFLGKGSSYTQAVNDYLRDSRPVQGGLVLPLQFAGQSFWRYYLEQPDKVSSYWRALVPFVRGAPAAISVQPVTDSTVWKRAWAVPLAFFSPFGVAIVVSVRAQGAATLEQAVEWAFAVRRGQNLAVQWEDGTQGALSIDAFANSCLSQVYRTEFGSNVPRGRQPAQPFSVFSVVRATGVDPQVETPESGDVHRALAGVSSWSPSWRHDQVQNLSLGRVEIRTAPAGHVLFGQQRGRAIWFPDAFRPQPKPTFSIAVYHSNLVFLSMLVDSLTGLLSVTANRLQNGEIPVGYHYECVQRAAGILGRLYGGIHGTYRSWSPRKQIDNAGAVADINEVRDYLSMPVLS